jgi:hypothetical protein
VTQVGPDRVQISGTVGSPPTPTTKVAINLLGGYRNTMTLVLTGLDIEAKAAWAREQLFGILGGESQFASVDVRLLRYDIPDAPTNEQATAHLRITVKDPDPHQVGRRFADATVQLAMGGYAGFHATTPPTTETAYGVYWPALIPSNLVAHEVVLPDGTVRAIAPTASGPARALPSVERPMGVFGSPDALGKPDALGSPDVRRVPLGALAGARSGDKGGNANVGIWARDPAAYPWLRDYLTVERFVRLVPESAGLEVRRYELAKLGALNFVIVGLLGEGVASSTRPDPQAKGLGEYVRSRLVDVPVDVLRDALSDRELNGGS